MSGMEAAINGVPAAFVAGLVTSVHCVGMCGPLACGVASIGKTPGQRQLSAGAYHGGRVLSYAAVGALAGAIGAQPLQWLLDSPAMALPWILIILLALIGLGLDKWVPVPGVLARWSLAIRARMMRGRAGRGGFMVGLATPLLPCGPLWLVLFAALASGSLWQGMEFMAAFALGTIPLLWVTQGGWVWVRGHLGVAGIDRARRSLALITAVVIGWRMRGTLWFVDLEGPGCCGGL